MHPKILEATVRRCREYIEAGDCHGEPPPVERLIEAVTQLADQLAAYGVTEVHTDHPLRHYDRTCPACNAGVTGSEIERLRAEQASNGVDGMSPPERFKWDQDDDDAAPYGLMVGPVPDGEWVRWRDVAHLYGVEVQGVTLPRELVRRAIEHLQTQATYSPSERNKAALLAVAGELLAHVSGVDLPDGEQR